MSDDSEIKVKPVIDDSDIPKQSEQLGEKIGKGVKKGAEDPVSQVFKVPASKQKKLAEDSTKGFLEEVGDNFDGFVDKYAKGFAVLGGAAYGLKKTMDFALDNILEGEKLIKIEKNFNAVAAQFGVAGDSLKDAFLRASGGITDDDELVKSLTDKMVTFNGQVDKLPKLFELSRKAANLFGRDANDVFDALTFAAQTGNTRGIRFLFPKLDLDKEFEKYAVAAGKLKDELTETERQQVALNKILEEGGEKLKAVPVDANTASEAFKRLGVSFDNFVENFQIGSAKAFGGFAKDSANLGAMFFDRLNDLLGPEKGLPALMAQADSLKAKIKGLEMQYIESFGSMEKAPIGARAQLANYLKLLEETKQKIEDQKEIARKMGNSAAFKGGAYSGKAGADSTPEGPSKKFLDAQKEIQNKYYREMLQADMAYQTGLLNNKITNDQKIAALDQAYKDQQKLADLQFAAQKQQIAQELLAKNLITQDQYASGEYRQNEVYQNALENSRKAHQLRLQAAEAEHQEKMRGLRDNALIGELDNTIAIENSIDQFMSGIKAKVIDTKNTFGTQMRQMGQAALQSLGNQMGKAFLEFAKGAKSGGDALGDFFDSFIATMGEMLVMSGFNYLLQGIAASLLGLPNGPALISTGGAMIAFGGVMAAVGGKSGGGATPSESGGGVTGGSLDNSNGNAVTAAPDSVAQEKGTRVQLNVYGNILDRRESALALGEILEEGFRDQNISFTS